MEVSIQPCLGHQPPTSDRGGRDVERFSRVVNRHSTEKTAFDDLALALIALLETAEGIVQRDKDLGASVGPLARSIQRALELVERYPSRSTAALGGQLAFGVIEEDLSHCRRRYGQEMRVALQLRLGLARQPQIGLMDQRGRVERLLALQAPSVCACDLVELPLHNGKQLGKSLSVSRSELFEEMGHSGPDGLTHVCQLARGDG